MADTLLCLPSFNSKCSVTFNSEATFPILFLNLLSHNPRVTLCHLAPLDQLTKKQKYLCPRWLFLLLINFTIRQLLSCITPRPVDKTTSIPKSSVRQVASVLQGGHATHTLYIITLLSSSSYCFNSTKQDSFNSFFLLKINTVIKKHSYNTVAELLSVFISAKI